MTERPQTLVECVREIQATPDADVWEVMLLLASVMDKAAELQRESAETEH